MLVEVSHREDTDPSLLERGDRLGGRPEPVGATCLDLDEDDDVPTHHHQVELALAATPVAGDDPVAPAAVPGCRPVLPRRAERPTPVGHR